MDQSRSVFVVIPLFNKKKYVAATISSLRAQTFSDWKAVVVDDGSTDGSAATAVEAAGSDSRIGVASKSNQGLAMARRTGLGYLPSQAEFILFLDSDDCLEEKSLEILTNALAGAPDAVGVAGSVNFIDESGVDVTPENLWRTRGIDFSRVSSLRHSDFLIENPIQSMGQVLLRRSKLDLPDVFQDEKKVIEDWDLWYRLTMNGGSILTVSEVTFRYRLVNGGMSRNVSKMRAAGLNMHRQWYHDARDKGQRREIVIGYTQQARVALPRILSQFKLMLKGKELRAAIRTVPRLLVSVIRSSRFFTAILLRARAPSRGS